MTRVGERVLFELEGRLKRRDERRSHPGKFSVVMKGDVPMPFAGRWKDVDKEREDSLGFSSSNTAVDVVFAAIDQGFVPAGISLNLEMLLEMSDSKLRGLLLAANIPLDSNW